MADKSSQEGPSLKKKGRQLRKRNLSTDSEDEPEETEVFRSVLDDTKELQKLRKRPNGVSVLGLAAGKKLSAEEELVVNDPFNLKTGGMIDMQALKGNKGRIVEEMDVVSLGNTFSAETNRRDEDADMMKYIDEELAKKKGLVKDQGKDADDGSKPEDVLFQVPEHLRLASSNKSEEMLSNQMLSGIPEVDLGIDERIRNIEVTEEAKQRMLKERMKKKDNSTSFVPTNMAVNFVQHNRFNIEDYDNQAQKKVRDNKPHPVVVKEPAERSKIIPVASASAATKKPTKQGSGALKKDDEKATDDFHFEKFKKQFRRY